MTPRNKQTQPEIAELGRFNEIHQKRMDLIYEILDSYGMDSRDIYAINCHVNALRVEILQQFEATK